MLLAASAQASKSRMSSSGICIRCLLSAGWSVAATSACVYIAEYFANLVLAWCRYIDQLMKILEHLGLHALAVPLCHLAHLLAGAVLQSPALASACQLKLAALAEALVLPDVTARAQKQAGPCQSSAAESSQHQKVNLLCIELYYGLVTCVKVLLFCKSSYAQMSNMTILIQPFVHDACHAKRLSFCMTAICVVVV